MNESVDHFKTPRSLLVIHYFSVLCHLLVPLFTGHEKPLYLCKLFVEHRLVFFLQTTCAFLFLFPGKRSNESIYSVIGTDTQVCAVPSCRVCRKHFISPLFRSFFFMLCKQITSLEQSKDHYIFSHSTVKYFLCVTFPSGAAARDQQQLKQTSIHSSGESR